MQQKPSGGDDTPSPLPPSGVNSHHPREMHRNDDSDGDSRKQQLFDLLRTSQQEKNDD